MTEPNLALAELQLELEQALLPGIQLAGELGRGGMGIVFLGRDAALKRSVVIKVLDPSIAHDDTIRRRFAREAESAAAVSHPGVVAIHGVGELVRAGTSYFVMQHIDGETLRRAHAPGAQVPEARVRRIIGEVASALSAAHARGVVHRDIKPDNIMIERATERAVVLDFGISAAVRPDQQAGDTRLTSVGITVGTPAYMSPEQAAGDNTADRADVYSLGVVAFELLAGRLPFVETNAMALAAAHIKDIPPPLRDLRPDIDPAIASLVARMLEKDPAARPASAEVSRALLPAAHATVEWPPPGLERIRGTGRRAVRAYQWCVLASALAVVVYGAGDTLAPAAHLSGLAFVWLVGVACAIAAGRAVKACGRAVQWARRSGYPLRVALDVAFDTEPYTLLMVNQAGPFASLPEGGAWRVLGQRRLAAFAVVGGATLTLLFVAAWVAGWYGTGGTSLGPSWGELALMYAPALAATAFHGVIARREHALAGDRRRRRFGAVAPAVVSRGLVTGWLAAARLDEPRRKTAAALWMEHIGPESALALSILVAAGAFTLLPVDVAMHQATFGSRATQTSGAARVWRGAVTRDLQSDPWGRLLALTSTPRTPAVWNDATGRAALERPSTPPLHIDEVWRAFRGDTDDAARLDPSDADLAPFSALAATDPPSLWFVGDSLDAVGYNATTRRLGPLTQRSGLHLLAAARAVHRGDRAGAARRIRETIAVGHDLASAPLEGAHQVALGVIERAGRALFELGILTADRALLAEGEALQAAVAARRAQATRFSDPALLGVFALGGRSLSPALAGESRLPPVDRWRILASLAFAACVNPGEIRRGVAPDRRALLAQAATAASDIPRTAEWVAQLSARLDGVDRGRSRTNEPGLMALYRPMARTLACSDADWNI